MTFSQLRKKYPRFIYRNYSYRISNEDLEISFYFRIEPNIKFSPKLIIKNINHDKLARINKKVLDNLVFHLGLIESISYWKATCSPEIKIESGYLDKKQIAWWKDLIINGMGQFFYENRIDFRNKDFLKINSLKKQSLAKHTGRVQNKEILVPIGGGKDSIVTLELLKQNQKKINCFSLNPTLAAQKVMRVGKCKNPIIIRRSIDKRLLELNRKGFLNGHTPFSAYLAFLSVLLGVLFDYQDIAFSNERSSNEGNVKYLGRIINHQYSKSFDFEKKFRNYSKKYLSNAVEYFSLLRPFYEIQIAKLFSYLPEYFSVFLSCNKSSKWCCSCPKCLFVFMSLYPFVENKELVKIFGKDLFKDKNLLPVMKELIGQRKFKPFECVGTQKESLAALYLGWKKAKQENTKLPYLLKYFEENILPKYKTLGKDSQGIMNSRNDQHNIPKLLTKSSKRI